MCDDVEDEATLERISKLFFHFLMEQILCPSLLMALKMMALLMSND